MKMSIVVNFEFEAVHCWPGCPIDEVFFLRHPHRHLFRVNAQKEVLHDDRDIEIIMFKKLLQSSCEEKVKQDDFKTSSCEQIAAWLLKEFDLSECSVLEDGENGARVIR